MDAVTSTPKASTEPTERERGTHGGRRARASHPSSHADLFQRSHRRPARSMPLVPGAGLARWVPFRALGVDLTERFTRFVSCEDAHECNFSESIRAMRMRLTDSRSYPPAFGL
jgi:hypothetical protein